MQSKVERHDAMVEYRYEGRTYVLALPAVTGWEEAEARLRALQQSGKVSGWPCFRFSANPITLPFGALWARIKAWLFDLRRSKS